MLAAAATASSTLAPVELLPFFSACEPGAFFFMRVVPELSVTVVTGAGVSALKMRVKRACERLRESLGQSRSLS